MKEFPTARLVTGRLAFWAETRPDELAFSFLDRGDAVGSTLTFRELYHKTLVIANQLRRHGLAGRPVLLLYPPGLDFITAVCGCLHAGAIAVPVPCVGFKRAAERAAAIAEAAEPGAVLTLSDVAVSTELRATRPLAGVPWIATDQLDAGPGEPLEAPPSAAAIIQYTSGSTGAPRGVVISHRNIIANMEMIRGAFGHDGQTRFVSWLPMFHDMGLVGCVLQPIYLGVSCATMSPLSFLQKPIRWLRAISRHRGTTSGAPNFAFELCARTIREQDCEGLDLSSWRVAFCGAEPVRPDTLRRFADRFAPHGFRAEALFPCYGLAEATLFVSGGPAGGGMRATTIESPPGDPRPSRVIASSGRLAAGQDLVIVDPRSRRPVAAGGSGEIWIAGPHVGEGYWKRPDATELVFRARIAGGDGRAFLRTGDLGFLRDGELHVTGRLKDLVILRGAKHHPEDIEATATRSHPALAGGGAAALAIEDGGEPKLVLLLEVDRRHAGALDVAEVRRAVVAAVTGDHGIRPDGIRLMRAGSLPRTTSGKIQRHRCRDAWLADDPLPA